VAVARRVRRAAPAAPPALVAALAMAMALAAPRVHAQGREVFPGDRVRLTEAERWTGFVQALDSDSIHVIPDGETTARPFALAAVERLEVSLGAKSRGRPFLIGGLLGAGLGAGTAALIGSIDTCDAEPDQFGFTPLCEQVGPVAIVASSVLGFSVGGAVGAVFGGGENWVGAVMPGRVGAVHLQLRLGTPATAQLSLSGPSTVR
jgi:hypothetical protein